MERRTAKNKDRRVEMSVEGLKEDFAWHLRYSLAKNEKHATERDKYTAFANAVRDRIVERWMNTQEEYRLQNTRRVYYLSLEFLMGRLRLGSTTAGAVNDIGSAVKDVRGAVKDAGKAIKHAFKKKK